MKSWALDIDENFLRLVCLDNSSGNVRLTHCRENVISNDDLATCYQELFDFADSPQEIAIGIGGEKVLTRVPELPIKNDDIEQAVNLYLAAHFPFRLDEVIWDWQVLSVSDGKAKVLICGYKRNYLDKIIENIARNVNVSLATTTHFAAYNHYHNRLMAPGPKLMINARDSATDTVVVIDNEPYLICSRNFPNGLSKVHHYFENQQQPIQKAYVTGNNERINEITQALRDVKIAYEILISPLVGINVVNLTDHMALRHRQMSYAVAIGLAETCLKEVPIKINLLARKS